MRKAILLLVTVGLLAIALTAQPDLWAAPGQDFARQTVPSRTPTSDTTTAEPTGTPAEQTDTPQAEPTATPQPTDSSAQPTAEPTEPPPTDTSEATVVAPERSPTPTATGIVAQLTPTPTPDGAPLTREITAEPTALATNSPLPEPTTGPPVTMTQSPAMDSGEPLPTSAPGTPEQPALETEEPLPTLSSTARVPASGSGRGVSPLFFLGTVLLVAGLILLIAWRWLG